MDPGCRAGGVPHPDQPGPEITEMDDGMIRAALRIKHRAATAVHPTAVGGGLPTGSQPA